MRDAIAADGVVQHPTGRKRTVPPTPAETLDLFAQKAEGRTTDALYALFERAAKAILHAQGSVCIFEVRIALGQQGLLANDGTESLDAFGSFPRRMGLVAMRREDGSVVRERPSREQMQKLPHGHGNVATRWCWPTPPLLSPVGRHITPADWTP